MAFGRVSFRSFDVGTEVSEFRGEPWLGLAHAKVSPAVRM